MSRSNQLAGLITATPTSTLDTINEINTSLNNDNDLSGTLTTLIDAKAPKASPNFTGDVAVTKNNDGGDVQLSINNSDTSSSTDETVTIKAGHAGTVGGKIVFARHGNYQSTGDKSSTLNFYTADDNSDQLRMHISKGGSVGIGITPATGEKFHVSGNSRIDGNLALVGNDKTISPGDSGAGYMKIHGGGTNNGGAIEFRGGGNSGDLRFLTGTSGVGTERMRIISSGDVGIGLTNMSNIVAKLHVYDDRDITNNPNSKGLRLDESSGKWLLSLGQSGTSNTSFAIRDVTNSKYPIVIQGQTHAGSTPAMDIYNDGRVHFDKAIFAEALRTLYLGRNTTLTINPYTQLGQYGQGGCFYVSFATWAGRAGLFQVRWNNGGGNGGIVSSTYDTIVNGGGGLGLTVTHAQNNSIYDSTISITSSGHHSNSHGWAGGVINFGRYDS